MNDTLDSRFHLEDEIKKVGEKIRQVASETGYGKVEVQLANSTIVNIKWEHSEQIKHPTT